MIKTLAKSPAIYQPSKLWLYFMIFNTFQLETGGLVNFKRTVNHNYFNWTADFDVNTQFQALKNELNWSDADLEIADKSVHFDSTAKPMKFTESKWRRYAQFLCMLWEFTIKNDRLKLIDQLDEPILGNPVAVEYKGRKVTQDICNSVIEVNTIMNYINHNPEKRLRVMELGAGHGRVGNVLLHAVSNIQIVIVDIPPALYVSQLYLTSLFPKHRAFKFRDFSSYAEIQDEFEKSSVAFLSPAQVEHLSDWMIELFNNISSLHEMTHAQIDMWFNHVDRLCTGWFYTKQYIESKMVLMIL
jgi:putative sugar O-methyltransferase